MQKRTKSSAKQPTLHTEYRSKKTHKIALNSVHQIKTCTNNSQSYQLSLASCNMQQNNTHTHTQFQLIWRWIKLNQPCEHSAKVHIAIEEVNLATYFRFSLSWCPYTMSNNPGIICDHLLANATSLITTTFQLMSSKAITSDMVHKHKMSVFNCIVYYVPIDPR